jgi:uncharacterized SAM-binding protein YcdF (DUF218 family)
MDVRAVVPVILSAAAVALAFGEVTHRRASRRRLGGTTSAGSNEAIVVLGYKNAGRRANYMNRYRVRAALRSIDPTAQSSVLVFCGGAVGGEVPEAELMEHYAFVSRGYQGPSKLDLTSMSTWENIQNAIPLIEDCDAIKIVSNSLHAEKGRAYLWKLRPDLAARLAKGSDYRFGEIIWVKPFAALLGLKNLRTLPSARS